MFSFSALIFCFAAYLVGAIPFGLVLTKLAGKGDIREIGSGNIGTTNVLRTGSKGLAAATLVLDALKGTIAVLLGAWLFGPYIGGIAGLCAFIGHLYPVWLKFKGGKGVATYLGVLGGLSLQGFLVFAICWLTVAFLAKFSSLAALIATLVTTLSLLVTGQNDAALISAAMTLLIFWKHSDNIKRLIAGTESKIGQK